VPIPPFGASSVAALGARGRVGRRAEQERRRPARKADMTVEVSPPTQSGSGTEAGADRRYVPVTLRFDQELAARLRLEATNRAPCGLLPDRDRCSAILEQAHNAHGAGPTSLRRTSHETVAVRLRLRRTFLSAVRRQARESALAEGLAPDDPAFPATRDAHLARTLERAFDRHWWDGEAMVLRLRLYRVSRTPQLAACAVHRGQRAALGRPATCESLEVP